MIKKSINQNYLIKQFADLGITKMYLINQSIKQASSGFRYYQEII